MKYYTIPLKPEPQSLNISLAGKEYRLTARWRESSENGWLLDIQTVQNSAPIVMGIPLVTGADLLEQYAYLEFGGQLWIDHDFPPSLDNLGNGADLVFWVIEDGGQS